MSTPKPKLKDIIIQEIRKCSQDPVYFMKKYYYIQHPQKGRILFNLYPFQEQILKQFSSGDYYIINKSRQLGISTLISAYSLWLMLFHKDKNILVLATTHDTAKNLITKVRFGYDELPSWLRIGKQEHNKTTLKLINGSQVQAKSATDNAARSEAVSLLVIDEAAFIENIDNIFTSAQQTLATGGQCIALSSPNGRGNWFYKTWVKSQNKENTFIPLRLPWTVHPERDQTWRDEQDKLLGKRHAAQECDADFITSGATVIDSEILEWYKQNQIEPPIEKRGINSEYWIWEYPDYTKTYAIVGDVARGDGADYSTFHVFDVELCKQVAEFKSHIGTKEFAQLLYLTGIEWNNALIIVENNSYGWDVLGHLIDKKYDNIYHSPKNNDINLDAEDYLYRYGNGDNMVPGFSMNLKTRPLIISRLISYMKDLSVGIKSSRTLDELGNFIWKNGKAQAQSGNNDDLVIPLGIILFLRETTLSYKKIGEELSRNVLNNISKQEYSAGAYLPKSNINDNPYKMHNSRGGIEDITWLLG